MFDFSLTDAALKIRAGHRLVPVMTPDEALGERYFNPLPTYRESYPLTHVVLTGDRFWGATGGTNQPYRFKTGLPEPVVLAYTNSAPIYASLPVREMTQVLSTGSRPASIAPLRHYRDFRFTTKQDAELVWDGRSPTETDMLQDAIEDGCLYRVVFEIDGGTLLSLPVDIPMYFPNDNTLTINTHPGTLPDFFAEPQVLIDGLSAHQAAMLDPANPNAESASVNSGAFPSFYSIRSDGCYYGVSEILSGTPKQWVSAKLFAY